MAGFDPIDGSIASVAIKDPNFDGCEWVYGKHAISDAFGENWADWEAEYKAQIENFRLIRDQTIIELTEDPLDETRTRLKASLGDELKDWISTFHRCEELIITCEGVDGHGSRGLLELEEQSEYHIQNLSFRVSR